MWNMSNSSHQTWSYIPFLYVWSYLIIVVVFVLCVTVPFSSQTSANRKQVENMAKKKLDNLMKESKIRDREDPDSFTIAGLPPAGKPTAKAGSKVNTDGGSWPEGQHAVLHYTLFRCVTFTHQTNLDLLLLQFPVWLLTSIKHLHSYHKRFTQILFSFRILLI